MRRYCIIGNGPGGVNAIEAIRKADQEGEIINISAEPYLPYSRPLLPFFVAGKIPEERVYFRPLSFYKDYNVDPILGEKVIEIEPDKARVILVSGKKIEYDKLLIASGNIPVTPKIEGIEEMENIFHLTNLDYAKQIVKQIQKTKKALVLGGGPQGLEVALALSHRGVEVTIIVGSSHVLSQILNSDAAQVVQKKLEESGIKVMFGKEVVVVTGKKKVEAVLLNTGEGLRCDLIIIGKGLRPNLEFLSGTQLVRTNIGIIVNQYLQTSMENIYAAGDVAETYDILSGRSSVVGIWPHASEQGFCAGSNMAGFPKEYVGVHKMNTFNFEGLSCIVLGDVKLEGEEFEAIVRMNLKKNIYQKIVLEHGVIKGVEIIGGFVNIGGINRFIRKKANVEAFTGSLLSETSTFIY